VDAVKRDKPFSKTNEILAAGGRATVDWAIP
jgi:hypothetical protein